MYQRRELSLSTASFGKAVAMLSNCDEHTSLSRALSQLADTEEKVEHVYLEQNNADFSIFCEMLKDYVCLIGAVKVCLYFIGGSQDLVLQYFVLFSGRVPRES